MWTKIHIKKIQKCVSNLKEKFQNTTLFTHWPNNATSVLSGIYGTECIHVNDQSAFLLFEIL